VSLITEALFVLLTVVLAFNLINDIDITGTEARIAAYRAANSALTAANQQKEEAYAAALKEQEEFDRKEREERAAEIRRVEEAEREEYAKSKRDILDELESSTGQTDARKVVAKSRAAAARRTSARIQQTPAMDMTKLLRTRSHINTSIKDEPHVALQDDWYAYEDMFTLQPQGYNDVFSAAVRKDRDGIMRGGGYMVEECWERAIRSAVASLTLPPLNDDDGDADVVMTS
jgi:CDK-activating kinase assembly factor MAT1